MSATEHKFLADFQPMEFRNAETKGGLVVCMVFNVVFNTAALFGVFFVIGRALKLGLGL